MEGERGGAGKGVGSEEGAGEGEKATAGASESGSHWESERDRTTALCPRALVAANLALSLPLSSRPTSLWPALCRHG